MKNYASNGVRIAQALRDLSSPCRQDELASELGFHPNLFSPSQKNGWRHAMQVLLENSYIAKTKNGRVIYYRLMRPIEEIEVFLLKYKWDSRHQATKDKAVPCKVIKPDISKAKDITIKVKDVTITISF